MDTPSTEPTINSVNPEIVKQIAVVYASIAKEAQDTSFSELLYRCVQSVLRKTARVDIDAIFVYYLHSYRFILGSAKEELAEGHKALTHACLSLFDVYKHVPKQHTPALLLRRAIKALTQVVVEIAGADDTLYPEEVESFATHLGIVAQTIDYYTAPVRISIHSNYLDWLKQFLIICITQRMDSVLLTDKTLVRVAQTARQHRKITLPF